MLLSNKKAKIRQRHIAYTYMKQGARSIAVSMYNSFTVFGIDDCISLVLHHV